MKDLQQWLEAKGISEEDFQAKSDNEKAGLYREYNNELRKSIDEAIEGKASKEDVQKLIHELESAKDAQFDEVKRMMTDLGLNMTKMSKEAFTQKQAKPTLKDAIAPFEAKLKVLGDKDASKAEANANQFRVKVSSQLMGFKAPGDMTITGNISGGNVPVEQRLMGVGELPTRVNRFLQSLGTGAATSNVISWVYEANEDGNAGGTAEGTEKNQIDLDFIVGSDNVKKRTAYIKASTEMLGDISWMETQLRRNLSKRLLKDVEQQAYNGDATGENLRGIATIASAFSAAPFAGEVDNANEIDVLTVAMDNIMNRDQPEPDAIFMNPSDVTAMKLEKVSSTDKRYVSRLQMVAGELSLDTVPIIPTTLIAQDSYLIGNFNLATLYDRGEISIEIGLDGNDFTKNMRTILAEWRGAMIVEHNDRSAYVAGVFSTDAAALETP